MQIFMSFYEGKLKQQMLNTAEISCKHFNPFLNGDSVLIDYIKFSQFWWSKCFSQI